ncbi:integrase [Candidatus Eisenbacteria bacterium]|uniref:Integrase n=1 Tax=Eiseniibacteriota bacterium TaxID=2212470 RepID=A0ABV6YL27_UNCEI
MMDDSQIETMEQVRQFLAGSAAMRMAIASKAESYDWVRRTLVRFQYWTLKRPDRGLLLTYLRRVSDYSRAQITRMVSQYRETGKIERRYCTSNGFTRRYTPEDIHLLVQLDALHGTLSGPATKKLCERAYHIYRQEEYKNLSGISVSHLYNLRHSAGYLRDRREFTKTRATKVKIGERRKPDPKGKPGTIRIDTVHQGDLDGKKGVYHINAVDEVTQFEVVGSVEGISERFLIPLLEHLLEQFPFTILGFHSDNGSEYVNFRVAKLLNKLLIEFTKSRPRHSNDNALVEAKNGAIVRKQFGYVHIPQKYASKINRLCRDYLNPYVNFHRPCFFAEIFTDKKGKERRRYPYENMMTPYEKLKSLPDAHTYLKAGITFEYLDDIANAISDNQAARRLNQARNRMFRAVSEREHRIA